MFRRLRTRVEETRGYGNEGQGSISSSLKGLSDDGLFSELRVPDFCKFMAAAGPVMPEAACWVPCLLVKMANSYELQPML